MAHRVVVRQHDFSFGEFSPEYAASGEREIVASSLKRARNIRLLNSGGWSQRPGSRRLATASGKGILRPLVTVAGVDYEANIRDGGIDIYTTSGVLVQSVESAPWDEDQALGIIVQVAEDTLRLAHNDFWTQVLTRGSDGVWTLDDFEFAPGAGDSILQLYYRFAAKGITLTPSARTGTINVTFSEDVLTSGHVGMRFRYGGSSASLKELQIATVVDGQHGTATVIDTLPPTYAVTVASGAGFRIGEDVQGKDSQAKGVVVGVATNVPTILMTEGFEGFTATGTTEDIVGPNTRSKITAGTQSLASAASSSVWDEQVFSPVRGYPGSVFDRSGRLGFTDFPQIPDAIAFSAPGATDDFDITGGDADAAIFERIGGGLGQRILHAVSSANLIVLTNKRAYYVPEDENTPLAASTISFVEIGPTGTSSAAPITIEGGVVYIEVGGNRVIGLMQTGDLGAPWRTFDISEAGAHLIRNPVSLAMTNGNAQSPERYVFALNEDGTVAVCKIRTTAPISVGWMLWSGAGFYHSMTSIQGEVYSLCEREIASDTLFLLERFDVTALLDASSPFLDNEGFDVLGDYDDEVIVDYDGEPIRTYSAALEFLAGATVHVVRGNAYLGEHTVEDDGTISDLDAADGDFEAGLHFDMEAVQWPAEPTYDQSPGFKRRRVPRVAVKTKDTGVFAIGLDGRDWTHLRPAYDQGDDFGIDPPLRSEVFRVPLPGWEHEPCVKITRPIPHPVTILSIAPEVSY